MDDAASGPPSPWVELHETHSGAVVLLGPRAVKLKKPVDFGFLDFTTPKRRRHACEREVRLNSRLAPDVYDGVGTLRGPGGEVLDHVVLMRRMPADRRLATLVRSGHDVDVHLRDVARQLAAFHARAERGPEVSRDVSLGALSTLWQSSFDEVARHPRLVSPAVQAEIVGLVRDYLAGRRDLIEERRLAGHAVDGHGDLMAEDIFCLDDGARILDCLEFDDRLRHLDQVDDAAFLAMDLEHLGAPQLGVRFLSWYAEFSGDHAPPSLVEHYLAYRAYVRAKVACLRHAQGAAGAAWEAREFARATLAHLRRGAVSLVLVGGPPGTGKSTVAAGVADNLGAVLLSTDRVRKEIAGIAPTDSAPAAVGEGIYDAGWSARTYEEVVRRAGLMLSRGETVVVDATWGKRSHRVMAHEIAAATTARLVQIRCEAPPSVVQRRVTERSLVSAAGTVSDATPAVTSALSSQFEPWGAASVLDTDRDPGDVLHDAVRLVRPHEDLAIPRMRSQMGPD